MTALQFAHALLDGDSEKAYELLESEFAKGKSPAYIFQHYVTGAMRDVGELWLNDEISVADEHLATATCDYVLAKFHSRIPRKKGTSAGKKAMFFTVEKEQHSLGMKMAAYLFEQAGWRVRMLGPNLPLSYAKDAANQFLPNVIGLSVTIVHHLEQLPLYLKTLEKIDSNPTMLLGSRLLSQLDFQRFKTDRTIFIPQFEDLAEILESEEMEQLRDANL
ncbi:cobalamin B12-binding domain-containing protein [Paenisporosarcina cavernae]|uniref:Cobalamin-binding protein n=1 Tax=Paenisporosarcina cavernae TaxID=2320858 RepID=A0A385YYL9_9BACL|nr:B12-binding domain-containing protein [Paenisporosarcina cavernae]AYC30663.1 cobalamin-binding protein [Paenisporosarcina cavernae]